MKKNLVWFIPIIMILYILYYIDHSYTLSGQMSRDYMVIWMVILMIYLTGAIIKMSRNS